ncbi:MAG: cytochrome-c peroxidase [Myxococcales bacterium]|nr:cytochrome-c peroxidase [Myxococcales bacterium]MCB9578636.1 cytochrome-c peroxidase [Polyangiaceae bacterium]
MTRQNLLILSVCGAALLAACKEEKKPEPAATTSAAAAPSAAPAPAQLSPSDVSAFGALPKEMTSEKNPITEPKVELGRMLYYDARFSKNQDISCNSCHDLEKFGVDGKPVSEGHKGQKGGRNGPTVYNAAGQFVQFWDGRAADVEEQAKGPVTNPVEMAMPADKDVLAVINSIPEYVDAFKKAFPDDKTAVSFDNFGKAIGAFERKLVTPSRWDKFIGGDASALTDEEKRGAKLFMDTGCTTCHAGPYVGGQMYQKAGLVKPWPNQKDQGRFEVTKNDSDKMMFKVPVLRNIAKTGPYFHDASATTLEQAVTIMADHQLGKRLEEAQVKDIVAFLNALTGDVPSDLIKKPELPKSTAKTPKPNPN